MPELPDVAAYLEALTPRIVDRTLEAVRVGHPFVVRTIDPPIAACAGRRVRQLERIGKRIVLGLDGDLFLVVHLMIAGRLHWRPRGAPVTGRGALLALDFADGSLVLTEAGSKRQAAVHVVSGRAALADLDPGGLEVLDAGRDAFAARLRAANHTLKRALTDPRIFSGIGNAYSDEILHAARLSPLQLTSRLSGDEIDRLHAATVATLELWIDRLGREARERFPEKVTAFRKEMAVHGKYGQPCPVCGAPVQRIVYATNEANYCSRCQTGGRLLSDRSLSRLLEDDWPRTLEELEARRERLSDAAPKAKPRVI